MAPLCLILLLGLVKGQPHNHYYPIFDKGQTNREANPSDDNNNTPSINALFFMQSPIDHTQTQPSGGRTITQKHGQDDGDSSPDLPPGLRKLFPTFGLTQSPTHQELKTGNEPIAAAGKSSEGKEEHHFPVSLISTSNLEKQEQHQSVQNDDKSLGLPGMFATNLQSDRKIRRYRNRNHHRKTNHRQSVHSDSNGDSTTGVGKTNTIAKQHFKFLSEASSSREAPVASKEDNTNSSQAKLQGMYSAKGNGQMSNPGHGIRRQRRQKRGTSMPSQAGPHWQTFYYRRPDGHQSGSVIRPRNHPETREDPLVRSLEIEEEEEEEEVEAPDLSAPPADVPKQVSAELANPGDVAGEEGEGGRDKKETLAISPGATQEEPADAEQNDESSKAVDDNISSSALSDNTTVNETLARQMFRSPMLVDYGSRVKPQDIIPPTESDLDDDMLLGMGVEEEPDPLWSDGGEAADDISLEAEDPKVEDPPNLPDVEPETETEPELEEEEIIESRIELPVIPLQPNLDPQLEADTMAEDSPEPEGETEPESEAEPEAEKQPSPSSEPEAEGESEPEQETGPGSPHAEPQPEWDDAKKMWGPWWEIHIYGIGMAFAVLAIYSFISVLRLWRKKNLLSQGYFIALNTIMFIVGFIRALYFLVDGYNTNGSFSLAGHYFLYSIAFPCLTSAFSILLLALLQTLKMQILSPKIQRTRVVVGIIAGHFVLSVSTDIIVGYLASAKMMMFVCQVTTVLWGLILFFGYIYVFRRLYKAAMWRQNEMMRLSLAKFKLDGISPITKAPRLTLNMAIKITLATAIFGLILAALQAYGMVGAFSVFSTENPNPWTWLAFKTGMLLTELAMCVTMSYIATQPFRYNRGGKGGEHGQQSSSCISGFIYMAPCRRIFECDSATLHDDDLSWNDLPITRETCQMDDNGAHVISEEATPMTANGRAAQAVVAAVVHNQNEREGSTSSKRSSKMAARPASLLVSDNGFIRFREDGEMGGSPVLLSTDDELENISGDNMIRNPFYRDLLRRQEKDRAVGRATFVNSDGITLQDEFGLVENLPDPELVPPPRPAYPVKGSYRGFSYPNTGTNTPGTPRSFCSTDLEYAASEISYRPPSSIHLRDSIENALNIPGFTLRTPDMLDSPLHAAYLRTRRGSLFANRIGARPMGTGSMSDLESLRHYGPGSRYGDSEDTMEVFSHDRAASPDSMYSYTLSNLTRAPLVRSYSDSIGKASHPEVSVPNSPERRFYKDRLRASMLRNLPENTNQFQNLLKNINEMCNVYNKLSPDDREGDE